jgi:hypothetical protein
MATIVEDRPAHPASEVEAARNAWILAPANTTDELDRWRAWYELDVPRPANSVPLPVIWA